MNRAEMIQAVLRWEQVAEQAKARAAALRAQLAEQARYELETQGTVASWKIPGLASVALPMSKPAAVVTNSDRLVEWARVRMPHAVEVKYQIRPASLTALLGAVDLTGELPATEDGELIPGVEIRAGGVPGTLTIRFDSDAKKSEQGEAETMVEALEELLSTQVGIEPAP